ncbi:transcriptional regulator, TetR family [Promicromonospora umidemergens]|uniref:TetR/AcrR family transcriptional regulator n=2 Tax=Promicromonospora umidemergens TaxID=629679 RepID=A0ABP8X7N2_9MICO|nr:TetR/AcrR family transcriptional regulator [Promicromonospora umidemergens]MCP2281208.1 transcriptional regulator, TetR family [Promicromonospora umidemergens]
MPKLADHDQRRTQITSAARRVIARDGLAAATFQSVAAEAGISVRLVQYYFGTKRKFLLATHHAVVADAGARFTRRLSTLGAEPAPREVIRAILTELLPTDADRRRDTIVLNTFHAAALTSTDVGAEDTLGAPRFLARAIAEQLRRARGDAAPAAGRASEQAAGRAAELDAELIVAGAGGLAQTLLVDDGAEQRVGELLDRLLDRMVEA